MHRIGEVFVTDPRGDDARDRPEDARAGRPAV